MELMSWVWTQRFETTIALCLLLANAGAIVPVINSCLVHPQGKVTAPAKSDIAIFERKQVMVRERT